MTGICPDDVPAASTLYCYFDSWAGATGAPSTISGFAVGDIKIYKDGGTTERASTSGFTLLDTDGIDFDGNTGINGFSVDLSDNTTAGFFVAGHNYAIVIATITVDGQSVNFVAGTFWIEQVGGAIALLKSIISGAGVNVTQIAGQAASAAAGVTFPSSIASPTNITAGTITTVTNLTNAPTSGDLTAAMKTSVQTAATAATPTAAAVTGNVGGNVVGSVASVVGNVGGNVVGSVASVTAGVIVTTNNDKTGYALAADARITKNVALSNFGFLMVDGTDFATPKTGVTITATISKDGGSFASCSNAAVEIANGWYRINLTQSEMNADVALLSFTGTGAAARNVEIFTQPAL